MSTKEFEVLEWLEELYGESDIPNFEKTVDNITKLHSLISSFKKAKADSDLFEKYLKTQTDCLENYGMLCESNLNDIGFNSNLLDEETKKCLEALTMLQSELHMGSTSTSNYMLSIHAAEEKNSKMNELWEDEAKLTESLVEFSEDLSKKLDVLKKISEQSNSDSLLKEAEIERKIKKGPFMKVKINDYQQNVKSNQKKLKDAGYDDSISLSSISKKVKQVEDLKKELNEKKILLESYSLPPDMALAEVEVEKLRQQLAEVLKCITGTYNDNK